MGKNQRLRQQRTLRYPAKNSKAQQKLCHKQKQCYDGKWLISLVVLGEAFHVHLCLLEFVDVLIYLRQFAVVGSTIRVGIRYLCYLAQSLRVYLYRHIHILNASSYWHGIRCHLVSSYSNGVYTHTKTVRSASPERRWCCLHGCMCHYRHGLCHDTYPH
jgi:hypothetical protein